MFIIEYSLCLVKSMELKVESEADEGTKVTIHIPAIPFNSENQSKMEEKSVERKGKNEKNKVIFLATEIILCVLALFFTFKMFDQNETEKKVAVIVQNSGDKNWNSFIKGLKESAKVNNIHLIICNADESTT